MNKVCKNSEVVEEARKYHDMRRNGWTICGIAKSIGMSRSYVSDRICLMRLSGKVLQLFEDGHLGLKEAYHISMFHPDKEKQRALANLVIDGEITLSDLIRPETKSEWADPFNHRGQPKPVRVDGRIYRSLREASKDRQADYYHLKKRVEKNETRRKHAERMCPFFSEMEEITDCVFV